MAKEMSAEEGKATAGWEKGKKENSRTMTI